RSERRQGYRRGHKRSGIQQLRRGQRTAAAPPARFAALFSGLQATRRQAGPGGRHPARLRRAQSDRECAGALQGPKGSPAREGRALVQIYYFYDLTSVLASIGEGGFVAERGG